MSSILVSQIKNNKISHAYIFEGQEEQTTQMYTNFIEMLYESHDNRDKSMGLDRFFDVEFILPEKNNISVDKIRGLKKRVFEIPLESKYKIFVIENAHMMNVPAQNSLLKTLEEAPSYAIIILATDNRNKLLDTIVSRCQIISNYLENERSLDETTRFELYDILEKAYHNNIHQIIASKKFFEKQIDRKTDIINECEMFFSDVLDNKLGIQSDFSVRYKKYLTKFEDLTINKIEKIILSLEDINELLNVNINFQLAMEKVLFTLMEG